MAAIEKILADNEEDRIGYIVVVLVRRQIVKLHLSIDLFALIYKTHDAHWVVDNLGMKPDDC